jgi:cytochrome c oxidase assembly protein subunit 15|tara:strand:+ start:6040 stop:7077 length:1038 start_codon:yes stop_codon:yes gene_type:complete
MSIITPQDRAISQWLLICLFLIFFMVVLGGVTRLTGSGLSMVNWHPIHGTVPPITSAQWDEEFSFYKQSPEFQKINSSMDVSDFKSIFWLEYSHRMLGRVIGLVFFVPFVYFWWRKKIKPGLTPKLVTMFVLGGCQGLLGWYMVKSGLVNNPHVSQYRLTAHLVSAILIYGFILWTWLDLRHPKNLLTSHDKQLERWCYVSLGLLSLILLTIVSGGFVAGMKAGLIYNTFPLMGGQWIPEGISALSPWYMNLFENKVTAQFGHRVLAIVTAVLLFIWYIKGRSKFSNVKLTRSFKWIGMMVIIQVSLGLLTLLYNVPIPVASMHQAGALLLFSAMLINMHALRRQ